MDIEFPFENSKVIFIINASFDILGILCVTTLFILVFIKHCYPMRIQIQIHVYPALLYVICLCNVPISENS